MWKVLIADDEPRIRRGLFRAVEWEKIQMQVCGFAENGAEALQIVQEEKPDICMVDICMPLVSGLELIEKIREITPDTVCIVITGYDEFEYAQQALKLGVVDYILKPVNEEQLLKTLMKEKTLLEEKEKKQKIIERTEKAEKIMEQNLPFLRQRFLSELTGQVYSKQEINDMLSVYQIELSDYTAVMRVVIHESAENREESQKDRILYQFILQNIAEEVLRKYGKAYTSLDANNHFIVLISAQERGILKGAETEIKNILNQHMKIKVSIRYQEIKNLGEVYNLWEVWNEESRKNLSQIVERAKKYLEENYRNSDLSVKETAEYCGVNASYLSRMFKGEMGINLIEYLTKIRIQKALYYLSHTDMMIYEIAEKTGYKSQHYFCVAFKKILDISPTEYRQRQQ